jgi:ribosomal protein L40E
MGTCHRCNAYNPGGLAYCGNCGARLVGTKEKPLPPMVVCANCKASNPEGSIFCFNCGDRLFTSDAQTQPVFIICPKCSAGNPEESTFCSNCGTRLAGSESKLQPAAVICPNCGAGNPAGSIFCYNCGAQLANTKVTGAQPIQAQPVPAGPTKRGLAQHNWKAITSMILGIIGVFAWFLPFLGFPVTIAGLVFGIFGLKSQKPGMAIAGLVLCCIFLIATIINSALGVLGVLEGIETLPGFEF